ncbi:MAG: HAD hydrolase-like protein [Gomphosphaeria aponina SAG 52.96 = DSM 107014]|uniref:HAD hydrolase-like protein n=1 Tax=Gomphosphaeria aponina SAG 52.96 = DSM 107014 TaxID=1521640 RepID=A0A941GVN3_9CHRO|nr:HAD hydrolase-like protein [Gomphosphaeria aponina SAG 52.96 = DSM 107014]
MKKIQLVVFDMAGTTVKDNDEVLFCFLEAAKLTGLQANKESCNPMMGWSKKLVFATLWEQQIGKNDASYGEKVNQSFAKFREILEDYYRCKPVLPTEGCLELFSWLKSQGIKIALNTGFYREVTNIILERLGWDLGLNSQFIGENNSIIQASVTPSEIYNQEGRPAPFMIQKAMYRLGITDPQTVIYIGDTPSDLASGKNANCFLSLGVTNGTHTKAQLETYPNDGLLGCLLELQSMIKT